MRVLPRQEFVPEDVRASSYEDHPLPIGYGQTISQPFIVALMTDLLGVGPDGVVLEIGTGSGYQAAVLARLVRHVYTVERIPGLAALAAERLKRLGFENVTVRQGDGYYGLPEAAPFDAIIVTAAAGHIPPPLLHQLKSGGRMVIPLGPPFGLQHLTVLDRDPSGRVRTRQLFPVSFVPLTGRHCFTPLQRSSSAARTEPFVPMAECSRLVSKAMLSRSSGATRAIRRWPPSARAMTTPWVGADCRSNNPVKVSTAARPLAGADREPARGGNRLATCTTVIFSEPGTALEWPARDNERMMLGHVLALTVEQPACCRVPPAAGEPWRRSQWPM